LKIRTAISVILAVLLQATLRERWSPLASIDFVLIIVVYTALQRDAVQAVLVGTIAGLAVDALSGGSILGANGLTKTIIAYLIAALSTRIVLDNPLVRIPVLGGASLFDSVFYVGLHRLFDQPPALRFAETASYKLIATTVAGTLLFYLFDTYVGERADRRRHFAFRRRIARRRIGRRRN
jgi:rod shape-determining protein MreD